MSSTHTIIDSTLREGEQTPGIHFSLSEKKCIIDGLAKVGISEIELGIASPLSPDLAELVAYCRGTHPGITLSLWSRCKQEDIDFAATLRPDILSLSIPASPLHIYTKMQKDVEWVLTTLQKAIARTIAAGMQAAIGLEDATRATPDFLATIVGQAMETPVQRVRLADTVGIATPNQITRMIESLRAICPPEKLALHSHNDFGMATANGITAFEAGVGWVDATLLGLGERTGCARLEELVGYLALQTTTSALHPEHLLPLTHYVATLTGRTISCNRPFIGKEIFSCETGLHMQGLHRDPATYEPYPPELVGGVRKLLYGAKSGKKALGIKLTELGQKVEENELIEKVKLIRAHARDLKRPLSDSELLMAMEK